MTAGQHTYSEIMSQPQVWAEVLAETQSRAQEIAQRWQDVDAKQVLFTGCGSTHYLSHTAAALLQGLTGVQAQGVPASEIVFFPDATVAAPEDTLLVTVSRSGTTTETAAAIDRFRQLGGKAVWGITCYPETPVGQETDFVLLAEAAHEQSVAQTRSFSSMLLITQALAAIAGGEDVDAMRTLPDAAHRLLSEYGELAQRLGEKQALTRFFFLGSGPIYGIACEVMLKMKEMSISHSEAYYFMEFRHGPKSLVDEHSLVTAMLSPRTQSHEMAVTEECVQMGGHALAVAAQHADSGEADAIEFGVDGPDWSLPALYLPVLQLLAYYRAISRGLDPDNPRNLTAVVELDRNNLLT
jgi:glucosamine--fructose-6-phosphate aminotransferase (isomerizing)